MPAQTALKCPRCGGRAEEVKAPGRGARKHQCQQADCRHEGLPFTLAQKRRREAEQARAARRIHWATPRPHWTERYG